MFECPGWEDGWINRWEWINPCLGYQGLQETKHILPNNGKYMSFKV